MKRFDNKSGFTLIEIIVVLIIVGILAAIALPNLFSNVSKSRSAEALSNIASIRPNVEACISGHQSTESTCTMTYLFPSGGAPTSPNFTYAFSTAPTNNNTGYAIKATGQVALASTDTITITRAGATSPALGAMSCAGGGVLAGAC